MTTTLPPSPPGQPLLKHLGYVRNQPLAFFGRCVRDYGDVVLIRLPTRNLTLVSFPEGVKHVLQDNNRQYDKVTRGYTKLRALLGDGLLTSEGDHWLSQRRLMQPAFHRQQIASFAEIMVRATETVAERWELLSTVQKPVDVASEMMRLTLRIVGEALFSIDLSSEADRVGPAITYALHHVNSRITKIIDPPEGFPTPANKRFLKHRGELYALVGRLIEERRQMKAKPRDLLTTLIEARDEETGQAMTDVQLRDEVFTLIGAGHETTANALVWTFFALDRHPAISARLSSEVRQVLGGRSPTFEDLPKLEYVRMVVDESMRLYPPVWTLVRRALADDEIGGFHIPAQSYVMTSQWTTHRNPRVWEDPDRFDPERFRKDRVAAIPRYAYFPFSGGPRVCIGNNFALMEAQLILATLAQRFRPRLLPGAKLGFDPQITLRPRHGLPMTIQAA